MCLYEAFREPLEFLLKCDGNLDLDIREYQNKPFLSNKMTSSTTNLSDHSSIRTSEEYASLLSPLSSQTDLASPFAQPENQVKMMKEATKAQNKNVTGEDFNNMFQSNIFITPDSENTSNNLSDTNLGKFNLKAKII